MYLLDHDEGALHALQVELRGHGLLNDDRVMLADIRDGNTLNRLMARIRPQVVFHAAAHKHLPLLERYPAEGIKTNLAGTANVVAAAARAGTETFVNISTDKAAAPTSVLGATKRLAERVISAVTADGVDGPGLLAAVQLLSTAAASDGDEELRAHLWDVVRDTAGADLVAAE